MAYKIIDDETALTIFEAIQESTTRSFGRYNCQRQLPKHKISGELLFYLDELLDFAERELQQSPEETLGQVIDQGLTAWFANLDSSLQRKLGFSLKAGSASASLFLAQAAPPPTDGPVASSTTPSDIKEALKLLTEKNKVLQELTDENRRLSEAVEALAAEKVALKREIAHLEQVHEELNEQSSHAQPGLSQYLSDSSMQSGYMALTTHSLATPAATSQDTGGSGASKKNKRKRKRKGGASQTAGNGRS